MSVLPVSVRSSLRRVCAVAALVALPLLAACTSASLDMRDLGVTGSVEPSQPFTMRRIEGSRPHHFPVHGIDVSKYQGSIDWSAVRQSGTAFAYLKATEGGDMLDDRFEEHWNGAKAAGVPRGAYHFFYWCRPGIEQARWFIENVPRDAYALPPVLDVEWTPFSPTCTRRPERAEMVREMSAFMDALERHYGVRPIIYAPIDIHRDRLVGTFPEHQVWLRGVRDHPDVNYEDREFRFWQYTESGTVDGVRGPVDRNAFSGSARDWERWLEAHRPHLRTARR
jgi:lysozyme